MSDTAQWSDLFATVATEPVKKKNTVAAFEGEIPAAVTATVKRLAANGERGILPVKSIEAYNEIIALVSAAASRLEPPMAAYGKPRYEDKNDTDKITHATFTIGQKRGRKNAPATETAKEETKEETKESAPVAAGPVVEHAPAPVKPVEAPKSDASKSTLAGMGEKSPAPKPAPAKR